MPSNDLSGQFIRTTNQMHIKLRKKMRLWQFLPSLPNDATMIATDIIWRQTISGNHRLKRLISNSKLRLANQDYHENNYLRQIPCLLTQYLN